jgi:hypothetical protein
MKPGYLIWKWQRYRRHGDVKRKDRESAKVGVVVEEEVSRTMAWQG